MWAGWQMWDIAVGVAVGTGADAGACLAIGAFVGWTTVG